KHSVYDSSEKGGIFRERPLNFFKGSCIGPAFEDNEAKPGKLNIKLKTVILETDQTEDKVVMNGGEYFKPDSLEDCKVLATFKDPKLRKKGNHICMIACNSLKKDEKNERVFSTVLLSCHPEHGEICL